MELGTGSCAGKGPTGDTYGSPAVSGFSAWTLQTTMQDPFTGCVFPSTSILTPFLLQHPQGLGSRV